MDRRQFLAATSGFAVAFRFERMPAQAPAIVLHGGDDAFGRQSAEISAAERTVLPRIVDKRIVEGAGHFVPHEKPEPVAQAVIDLLRF